MGSGKVLRWEGVGTRLEKENINKQNQTRPELRSDSIVCM